MNYQDNEDAVSVRTPTKSELNTFKVLANLDFTNLQKAEPNKNVLGDGGTKTEEATNFFAEASEFRVVEERRASLPHIEERRESLPRIEERRESLPRIDRESMPRIDHESMPQGHNTESKRPDQWGGSDDYVRERSTSETRKAAAKEAEVDVTIEKEALLYELEVMEKQGLIKLHRQLTMSNSLEEIQYQYDRSNMIVSSQQTVDWAKTGIKMGSSVLETVLKKLGLSVVDGFSNNLCKDMSKFNRPLTKMVRKYWRRGASSPEMELGMIVFGALAMTVMANKGIMGNLFGAAKQQEPLARPVVDAASPSAMKPPSFGQAMGPSLGSSAPSFSAPSPALPEWAKVALSSPLPSQPMHFAKVEYPEVARNPPLPMHPVVIRDASNQGPNQVPLNQANQGHQGPSLTSPSVTSSATQLQASNNEPLIVPSQSSQITEGQTRTLTLQSPKSVRRRKEVASELNLDEN